VRFDGGSTTFKRVYFERDADGGGTMIRLQPRNPKYQAQMFSASHITGMYLAVARYQMLGRDGADFALE
jgi:hypothetical protein